MTHKSTLTLAPWEDPKVQLVYDILCDDEVPLAGELHWEGFAARRIVAALAAKDPLQELADLSQEIDVAADAARYRWLRHDNASEFGEPWAITRYAHGDQRNSDGGTCPLFAEELDAAIDAARAQQGGQG